ncbi:MAG: GTP-binding protein [Candidatus Lokiarchaeota archaeon]|nr:GTP-binding protein [Candidatus Lokiarchaeota archaeon]
MKTLKTIESADESIKIVLIGLDNSGKTSILSCLKGIKRISAFNSPMPTKGLDVQQFESLHSKYAIWDLGGQQAYLDDYFNDFNKYVKGANKIIYVIDIQNVKRYEIALEYLEKVINSIDKKSNIDFSVFLHKFDPDLVFDRDLNEKVINNFIANIKETIPPEFIYSLYKTTIYAIFEKSTAL